MKNIKTLVVIVAVLITANCVLIGWLWYNNYSRKQHNHTRPMQGPAFVYLTRELHLNADQVKKYAILRDQHIQFTRKTGEQMRLQRDSFFDNLKNPNANPAAVAQLEKRILANQGRLDSATFYHFRSFRKLLNAGQATKFDSIISNVLHMMAQPPHPQGPLPNNQRGDDRPMYGPPNGQPGKHGPNGPQGYGPPPGNNGRPGPPNGGPPMYGPPPPLDSTGRPMHGPLPGGRRPPLGPDGRPMGPPPGGGPPPQGPPPGQ